MPAGKEGHRNVSRMVRQKNDEQTPFLHHPFFVTIQPAPSQSVTGASHGLAESG